ncbi:MAG: RHS repeat-associated core domain-containing protein [Solimonas sp.]
MSQIAFRDLLSVSFCPADKSTAFSGGIAVSTSSKKTLTRTDAGLRRSGGASRIERSSAVATLGGGCLGRWTAELTRATRGGIIALVWLATAALLTPMPLLASDSIDPVSAPEFDPGRILEDPNELLGERYDPYSGNISFSQTDVRIKGTGPEIIISRRYSLSDTQYRHYYAYENFARQPNEFGNWDLEVPNITVVLLRTQSSSNIPSVSLGYSSTTCSAGLPEAPHIKRTSGAIGIYGRDYSGGYYLNIPKKEPQLVYTRSSVTSSEGAFPLLTKDNWQISCSSDAVADGGGSVGEGFIVHSPDGVTYYLNHLTTRSGYLTTYLPSESAGGNFFFARYKMQATKIEDRYGNTVSYNYNSAGRVSSVVASDGRSVTINYNSDGLIASISSSGRTWAYGYSPSYYDSGAYLLSSITRPDGSAWSFAFDYLDIPQYGANSQNPFGTITTPYGLTAKYTVEPPIKHAAPCIHISDVYIRGHGFHGPALVAKEYYGANIGSFTWSYDYSSSWTTSSSSNRVTTISNPDGSSSIQTLQTSTCNNYAGYEIQEDLLDSAGTTARSTVTSYAEGATIGYAPDSSTFNSVARTSGFVNATTVGKLGNKTSITLSQDGSVYTTNFTSYDLYGHPLSETASYSGSGTSKVTTYSYHNDTTNWIVGLPASETSDGLVPFLASYNSAGRLNTFYEFGLLKGQYTYDVAGNIASVSDALSRVTQYSNYYRGIPQSFQLADGTTVSQVANEFGEITSRIDGRGDQFGYARDALGRVSAITFPSGDSVSWSAKSVVYAYTTAQQYGISTGTFYVTSIEGRHKLTTYYDELLQPILVVDLDSDSGVARCQTSQYDYRGLLVFKSYWNTSYADVAGIHFTYDAIGRLTQWITTDGIVLETDGYSSGSKKTITDGEGNITAIQYQAFGRPEYDKPILITGPEGQVTTISRDVLGKILSITQGNVTRSFLYNSNALPCLRSDPESGSTLWGYDAAGQLRWEAKGQTSTTCLSSKPSGATAFTYDALGRKIHDDYSGTADDVAYGYDGANNLISVSNASSSWAYSYDKRNLLESSQATIDGNTFLFTQTYDSIGHISSQTSPSRQLALSPDAWGRPTQVGNYVTSVQYHPNGLVASYNLGNGLYYSQTLNSRMRPETQTTLNGSAVIQKYQYGFSVDGDLVYLIDESFGGNDGPDGLTLAYDGLHRLTSASGLWGNYQYAYDSLGNILQRISESESEDLTYAYNSANLLSEISGAQSRTYTYNAKGEVTGDGSKTLTLNNLGQISSVNGIASYSYDGNGRRIKSVKRSVVEYALYDTQGRLVYTEKGTTKSDYLSLGGQVVCEVKSVSGVDSSTFLHPDFLGSPRKATDSTGDISWIEHYDPYGDKLNSVTEKIGYTGHAYDEETGYTYMQARFYDATVGRFLSTDSVNFKDDDPFTFNRYSYANNNPYKFTDPDGRSGIAALGGVITETWNALDGRGFDGAMVLGALKDGYNGEGDGVIGAVLDDATAAGTVAGGLGTLRAVGVLGTRQLAREGAKQAIHKLEPSAKTIAKIERQLDKDGLKSVLKSQQKFERRIAEHETKLEQIKASGGYTSSVEREIRGYEKELEAIRQVLDKLQ